jgi:lipopolysaccharide transport system permease protein
VVLNAWVNFLIILTIFLLFLILTGLFPGWPLLAIVPVLALQTVLAIGLGVIVGILNVFFRDVGQLFNIALQLWFWVTPVIYPLTILPDWARALVMLNPMTAVVTAYQSIFVSAAWPQWLSLVPAAIWAIVVCILALALFRSRAGEMVDEL